jgi:hypothetical protein
MNSQILQAIRFSRRVQLNGISYFLLSFDGKYHLGEIDIDGRII